MELLFLLPFTAFMLILSIQALYNIQTSIFGWFDSKTIRQRHIKKYAKPAHSFTVLLPAYHEEAVIKDTIRKISYADYPTRLMQVLVLVRRDDTKTITAAAEAIIENKLKNIDIVVYEGDVPGKPAQLNQGLQSATGELLVIFDAEDDVSPQIFNIANTIFSRGRVDVLQAGVQLMDYNTRWYSVHNILEYFFQFRSRMHYQAKIGMLPLGGNTCFFRTDDIKAMDGWDELCLTEDAELGLRLSSHHKKFRVYYEPQHVTREETPDTLNSFIKQRTRWNQGFIQTLRRPFWRQLPRKQQRMLALYTLGLPMLQALTLLLTPLFVWMAIDLKLPVLVSLLTYIPMALLLLLIAVQLVGLREFSKDQNLGIKLRWYLILVITFIPFQFVLGYAALRAMRRELKGTTAWEKTEHSGLHRETTVGEAA